MIAHVSKLLTECYRYDIPAASFQAARQLNTKPQLIQEHQTSFGVLVRTASHGCSRYGGPLPIRNVKAVCQISLPGRFEFALSACLPRRLYPISLTLERISRQLHALSALSRVIARPIHFYACSPQSSERAQQECLVSSRIIFVPQRRDRLLRSLLLGHQTAQ